jgi:hypothetical protein
MTEIVNNFSGLVIAVDNRDPATSWKNHLKRGSAGGVDLVYPYGTPVLSPADGVFKYTQGKGSGGNIGSIHLDDGRVIELMHLSAASVKSGTRVKVGTQIGLSGASGYGKPHYYSPHLHVHLITAQGARVNLFNYFTKSTITPVSNGKPITVPEDELSNEQLEAVRSDVVSRIDVRVIPLLQQILAQMTGEDATDDAVTEDIRTQIVGRLDQRVIPGIQGVAAGQVALTDAQVSQIVEAAKSGAESGVKALSFVVSAQ